MGFKEALSNFMSRRKKKTEQFENMETDQRLHKLLEQKQKSSNERELETFLAKERERDILQHLQEFRRKEKEEIHAANPINNPNITKDGNDLLKQKNIFKGKSMFSDNEFIHKNNPNLLRNNKKLLQQNDNLFKNQMKLMNSGGGF